MCPIRWFHSDKIRASVMTDEIISAIGCSIPNTGIIRKETHLLWKIIQTFQSLRYVEDGIKNYSLIKLQYNCAPEHRIIFDWPLKSEHRKSFDSAFIDRYVWVIKVYILLCFTANGSWKTYTWLESYINIHNIPVNMRYARYFFLINFAPPYSFCIPSPHSRYLFQRKRNIRSVIWAYSTHRIFNNQLVPAICH